MQYPHILTRTALTVLAGGVGLTIHSDDSRWSRAIELLREEDGDALVELMQPAKTIQRALNSGLGEATGITIQDGILLLDGQPIDADTQDYTVQQILEFNAQGLPFGPLVAFYNRLRTNPSLRVRRDLLKFLEYGKLPITEDGCFMAYKYVREDFFDCHSGTLDYTPGNVVTMPRHMVDDDPNNTCSYGLHVCSYEYLPQTSGGMKIVSCKIDPADVVSIPTDYNNTKMRVCKVTVVEEIPMPDRHNVWDSPVVPDPLDQPWKPKFGIGDKVSVNNPDSSYHGEEGTIVAVDSDDYDYRVRFTDSYGRNHDDWFTENELENLA